MASLWLRIKIWFKVTLVVAMLLYVIFFVWENSSQSVHFWYWFNHKPDTNLLLLVFCSFVAGILATLLIRTTIRTIRQIQDIQDRSRAQRLDRQMTDIQNKAAKLQTKPAATTPPTPPNDAGLDVKQ